MVRETFARTSAPVVLTSQVPPGFCRSLGLPIYHMCETLRVTQDTEERALNPEQMIVGVGVDDLLPDAFWVYLSAFNCPIVRMTWESAEFAKIAINMTLAAQVDNTNRLSHAAGICGAAWGHVALALGLDKRIGPHAYLTPGDWKQSAHLLRDYVTLKEIEGG